MMGGVGSLFLYELMGEGSRPGGPGASAAYFCTSVQMRE